jgi:hypothetical protein
LLQIKTLGFPKPNDTYHFTLDNTITIKDTTKFFQPNELAGKEIFINGYTFKIISNTQNTIKFKVPENYFYYYFPPGSRPIKAGDRYFVLKGLPSNGVNDVDYDPSSSALYIATSNGISIKQGSNWYLRNVKNTSSSFISGEITSVECWGYVGCWGYIEDSSQNWIPDEHKGKWVETDTGSWCYIEGNDSKRLWVEM